MKTTARLFGNGKVTIPSQIRTALELGDGDYVEIDVSSVHQEMMEQSQQSSTQSTDDTPANN